MSDKSLNVVVLLTMLVSIIISFPVKAEKPLAVERTAYCVLLKAVFLDRAAEHITGAQMKAGLDNLQTFQQLLPAGVLEYAAVKWGAALKEMSGKKLVDGFNGCERLLNKESFQEELATELTLIEAMGD